MEIESFFPGRIRVRSAVFQNQATAETALEQLRAVDGIREMKLNARTGSLTILYDTKKIGMDMLLQAKSELEKLELQG